MRLLAGRNLYNQNDVGQGMLKLVTVDRQGLGRNQNAGFVH